MAAPTGWAFLGGVAADRLPAAAPESPTSPDGPEVGPGPSAEFTPETLPAAVDRVIEAIFPGGAPLLGAVPLDLGAIEAGANDLLDRLPTLGVDGADGWVAPDRWAWLTAGVLVASGAAYAARPRRPGGDRIALGTDSALARWEERRAGRTR